ncbi:MULTISPECIES: hypothetical protein [unclassified Pseudomonas]|uniref:hypothetical protein n=1 Tax=unclassified Pseudomonas TaxID=196821 RepID=UPI0025DAC822|nr:MULTISPECIES: hypothetical protein [unclassified Pseudomonas]
MLYDYQRHLAQCKSKKTPPTPLTPEQAQQLIRLLENPPAFEEPTLLELFERHIHGNPQSEAHARHFLFAVINGVSACNLIGPARARRLLDNLSEPADQSGTGEGVHKQS